MLWEADAAPEFRPRLFTTAEWEQLNGKQRAIINIQRKAAVAFMALEHERRFHATEHLTILEAELHDAHEETQCTPSRTSS